jgi:ribosomal protein S18 acetylase RimI-like enzyme
MIIRAYTLADWPRLCAIHDAARLDELRLSAGEAAFLTLEQTAEGEGLFDGWLDVAEIDGVIEGFVAYSAEELTWLYVNPACYRRSIGRALLRHALVSAAPGFRIEVLEGNEPALRLYLDEGFQIVQRVEGRLEGNDSFAATGYVLEYCPEQP